MAESDVCRYIGKWLLRAKAEVSQDLVDLVLVWAGHAFFAHQVRAGDPMWDKFVAPHRKTLGMGNYTMHYIDIGQGEPVVMVHGFSLSTYSWRNNIHALLNARFRVILVNLPGHGQTDIPSEPYPYTVEQISNDIITMTDELGIEQFHLIGHSLGAGLTLYTSFHYPQNLRKAIVIDPPAFGPPRRLLLTYPGMTFVASVFFGRWTVKLNLKAMYYNDSLVVDEMIDEYTRPTHKEGFWNMLSALSHQYFSSKFDQMQHNYHQSEIPLLIVWGEKDAWVPLDTASKLHERISNSRLLTVPNCGHNPHEECPERVNPVVVEFLTKHD